MLHAQEKFRRRHLLKLTGLGSAILTMPLGNRTEARAHQTTPDVDDDTARRPRRRSLDTRLTEAYGVQYPFVGAGMGFVAMPPLVAAVSKAGGIGVLGAALEPPPGLQQLIQMIKGLTSHLFGVDFLHDTTAFGPAVTEAHIDVCLAEAVPLVVFHFNVPPPVWVDRLQAGGAKVWMQAASAEQAMQAADIGIDAIIAQGVQAGGHVKSTTRTIELLHQIKKAVDPLIVLAAGGIADGAGVARALANGAEGVWVGTRLVASTEAYAHEEYKRRLTHASGHATAITTAFGPEYPNVPYRLLRNRVVKAVAGHEDEIPNPPPPPATIGSTVLFPFTLRVPYTMPQFSAVIPTPDTIGDFEEMSMPAGEESVKLIKAIKPAAQIVAEMMAEARALLAEAR